MHSQASPPPEPRPDMKRILLTALLLLLLLLTATGCRTQQQRTAITEHRLTFRTDSTLLLTTRTDTILTRELSVDIPLWQFFPLVR